MGVRSCYVRMRKREKDMFGDCVQMHVNACVPTIQRRARMEAADLSGLTLGVFIWTKDWSKDSDIMANTLHMVIIFSLA